MHIGLRTWYEGVSTLEGYGLVTIERTSRGRRARCFHVTRRGRRVLDSVGVITGLVEHSRAAWEGELDSGALASGSARAGEILCRLIEEAERTADTRPLGRLQSRSVALKRPGETYLACALECLLVGDFDTAALACDRAIELLGLEESGRSFRKALALRCAVFDSLGDHRAAYREGLRLRKLSRAARDLASEAEAHLVLGIGKVRRAHWLDALREFKRGVECARISGRSDTEAKLLANAALIEFVADPDRGLGTGLESLASARDAGNRFLIARAQAGLALMHALNGNEWATAAALREARSSCAEASPLCKEAFAGWSRAVRRALDARRRHAGASQDCASALLPLFALVRLAPSQLGVLVPPGAPASSLAQAPEIRVGAADG